jgi:SAM-dependent methyltransferase
MPEFAPLPPQYDRIAHLYDVDMGRNMRFDDVGFYRRVCAARDGGVLEVGCGNGRILLELQAAGVDAIGIDGSPRMLGELAVKAAARHLPLRACRMDARRLAFGASFDVVLCPYSLVTYMTAEGDAARLLAESARVLRPGGVVVVDAFVPRVVQHTEGFTRDYVRPWGAGSVVRSKRVTALSPAINRIERRYEVFGPEGESEEVIETCEDIRPFAPHALLRLLADCGFRARETWWNYASAAELPDAQFFTVVGAPGSRNAGP